MAGFVLKIRSHLIVFHWDKETSLLRLFTLAPEIKEFFSSSKWKVANFLAS